MQLQHTSNEQRPSGPKPVLKGARRRLSGPLTVVFVVFLFLVVLTGISVYSLQQTRITKLQNQVITLQTQHSQESTKLASSIQSDKFQAVFVNTPGTTGGQAYFGHLSLVDSNNYKLTDIYYISDTGNLVKLGAEPQKPQDAMYIPRTSVIFWENLQDANQFAGQLK